MTSDLRNGLDTQSAGGPSGSKMLNHQQQKQQQQYRCTLCQQSPGFPGASQFARHLRSAHLTREGGSYLCRYGPNSVCQYQPMEGVSERDYELHVLRHHVTSAQAGGPSVPDCVHTYREVRDGVTPGEHWTPLHSVVNLPAVLNDPRRNRQSDVFSRTWGDAFERAEPPPSALLPAIGRREFERYLATVAAVDSRRRKQAAAAAPGLQAAAALLPPPAGKLSQVSRLFFQPDFDIRQKEVFAQVLPWQALSSSGPGGWRQLQEQLTQQLDAVEEAIAGQVSRKSHALFQTSASQDDIRSRLDGAVQSVRDFRQRLAGAKQASAGSQLAVLRCWRRQRNCQAALERLQLLLSVRATQPTIQQLLAATDYCGALDLMNSAQEALGQQLRGLHCCRHLHSQLAELRKFVGRMVESELVSAVGRQLSTGEGADALGPCALGMLRYGRSLHDCAAVLKREAFEHLRVLVRTCVQSHVQRQQQRGPGAPGGGAASIAGEELLSLTEQMRQLDFTAWLAMLDSVCKGLHAALLNCSQAVAAVRATLGPLCSLLEAEQMLVDVRQNAQEKVVKLLSARAKDAFLERLSPAQFVSLSALIEAFACQLDAISLQTGEVQQQQQPPAQSGSALMRSALHSQALRLVGRFHAERKTNLSLLLDNERWKPADVPAEFQLLADAIGQGRLGAASSAESSSSSPPPPAPSLQLCGEHFRVSGATLMLVKFTIEYCRLATDLRHCAAREVLGFLVELLKHFNSRCCQLVLGAGAIQLVGLNTITTKNLCLAQRSLQLVLSLLPHVTAHFVSRLGLPAACQRALLDTAKDYGDHAAEITRKLVELMESKARQELAAWQFRPPSPSAHIRAVVQAHCKLHENIAQLLPRQQVTEIFLRLHNSFKADFRRKLRECGVTNDRSPQHLHASTDMAFYLDSLRALQGLENFNDDFADLWA